MSSRVPTSAPRCSRESQTPLRTRQLTAPFPAWFTVGTGTTLSKIIKNIWEKNYTINLCLVPGNPKIDIIFSASISHAFFVKILKFLLSKDWKFPEFLNNDPTFYFRSNKCPSVNYYVKLVSWGFIKIELKLSQIKSGEWICNCETRNEMKQVFWHKLVLISLVFFD